jgi:IS5 family transposase
MQLIENVVNGQLLKEKRINPKTQIVDTTAMEKHIAFPTDGNLLHRAIGKLSKLTGRLKKRGLSVYLRSFKRLARKQILKINKFGRGSKQRREEGTKNLIGYLKQMLKAVPTLLNARKKNVTVHESVRIEATKEEIKKTADLAQRVINQAQQRLQGIHVKNKVFSLHEPDTTVIAKGKRSKRYEFGSKVSLSQDPAGYILGHQEYHQNVADINTLEPAINHWAKTLGEYPDEVAGDRGYHTSNIPEALTKVKRVAIPTRGRKKHPDQNKRYFKRLQRCRNHIEPAIGHLKNDHRLNRSRYKGKEGDTLNVGWAVLAWNSKKWSRELRTELKMSA